MEIINLHAENFCCFSKLDLDLNDRGLVWVSGNNKDSDAAENNGSGKSTIFKSLSWGLYGQCIDGSKADKIIKDGADKTVVVVTMQDSKGGQWVVERERKKGSPKITLIQPNGEVFEASKDDTQDKINEMIGLDFLAFKNTVLYGQNDTARFANPKTRDSERKDMLNKILRTGILKDCHERVLKERKKLRFDIAGTEVKLETLDERLEELNNDILSTRDNFEEFEKAREHEIEQCSNKAKQYKNRALERKEDFDEMSLEHVSTCDIDACKTEIKNLTLSVAEGESAKTERGHLYGTRGTLEDDKHTLKMNSLDFKSKTKTCDQQLNRLSGSKCPVCESDLSKGSPAKLKKGIKKERDEAEHGLIKITEELGDISSKIKTIDENIDLKEEVIADAAIAERKIITLEKKIAEEEMAEERLRLTKEELNWEIDHLVKRAKEQVQKAKEASSKENPYDDMFSSLNDKVEATEGKIRTLKKQLKKLSTKLSIVEFWCFGFSGKGLPSFLLDSVMPFLTERANEYLEILSDGDIEIEFRTQKELKSGKNEIRDTIEIAHLVEGVEGYPPSGGQLKKIEIATDFALMDLVASREDSNLNLLCLDEILDGLDSEGRARVLLLLQKLKVEKGGSIFVISHEVDISEVFEDNVVVTKEDGDSILIEGMR
jgi:DNA repair exonuclease SbcCD ATPase subunit